VVLFGGRNCDGVVERVGEGGIVWAEGHFANDVGEVECWAWLVVLLGDVTHLRRLLV
jgi:hypothetical protein